MKPEVLVVSRNPQTRDGLQSYLREAGLAVASTSELAVALQAGPCRAVILFPDEFAAREARATIESLRSASPTTRLVVVTGSERAIFPSPPPRDSTLVVLPRPAFGWTILDALRAPGPPSEGS